MGDIKDISETLKGLKKQIVEQIESLKADLEAVERLLKKHSLKEDGQLPLFDDNTSNEAMKPTEALLKIFNDNPNKSWTPSELRDEFVKLKERNLLLTESKSLLSAIHTILQMHVKNGDIIKDYSKNIPEYRRKI